MTNKILLERNGVKIIKLTEESFSIAFSLEHSRDIRPLINLNLVKLLHDVNPDLFEALNSVHINAHEQHLCLLFKDLFADLGIPQYYYNFSIKQEPAIKHNDIKHNDIKHNDIKHDLITFRINPIDTNTNIHINAMGVPITQCDLNCTLINHTVAQFNCTVHIRNAQIFNSAFFEKLVATLLYKVINRLKQFISTIT